MFHGNKNLQLACRQKYSGKADLPIRQPTKCQLAINVKAAKGSASPCRRRCSPADEVIEQSCHLLQCMRPEVAPLRLAAKGKTPSYLSVVGGFEPTYACGRLR